MATPRKLTDAIVNQLKPAASTFIAWDSVLPGFGCRVTAHRKAFIFNYRTKAGRQRQLTIGSIPAWSTSMARDEAKRLRQLVDQGFDPMGDIHELRAAPTMNDLADLYRETHLPRKRSARGDERMLTNDILPKLGSAKVQDVTHTDIASLHRTIAKRAPIVANRVVSLLSTMFAIAIKHKMRTDNPARGIERMPEDRRERYLSPDETARLMQTLDRHPGPSADAIRLLLLTGSRRMEVLRATWSQFDLDAGVWVKPAAATKQGKLHRVPLGQAALEVLHRMRAEADDRIARNRKMGRIARVEPFLFPAIKGRRGKPMSSLEGPWKMICTEAGLSDIRVHDLRHSFASILASGGASLPIIGAMLGHSQAATTARYAHLLDRPLRDAADLVGNAVASAKPRVLPMRRAD
jgi:integrase